MDFADAMVYSKELVVEIINVSHGSLWEERGKQKTEGSGGERDLIGGAPADLKHGANEDRWPSKAEKNQGSKFSPKAPKEHNSAGPS